MSSSWERLEDLFVGCATKDLEACGEVDPVLAAYRGEEALFLAWLRPFEKGCYDGPLIELLALAMPLDADRLALSIAARAWSLEDPIPPVTEDADLRQRILVVHVVDGAASPVRTASAIHPFDLGPEGVSWGEVQRFGPGEGWIPRALEVSIASRHQLQAPDSEIRKQAERVIDLGHKLYVAPDLNERLALAELR
jgi:hypothetical protein